MGRGARWTCVEFSSKSMCGESFYGLMDCVLEQGRVTEASVKNFQLCCSNLDESEGAFCICIACMDGKIADRKGYEYMRKIVSSSPKTAGGENRVSNTADELNKAPVNNRKKSITEAKVEGSISGSGHTDVKQTTQYLKDKFSRTFKR